MMYAMSEMEARLTKLCSSEKSNKKQAAPVKIKHLSCSKLIQSVNKTKERERAQPVRVTQLFDNCKESKTDKKDNATTAKKILPTRLTHAFTASKNIELSEKKNVFPQRNVRRNLIPTFEATKKDPQSNLNNVANVPKKAPQRQKSSRLTVNFVQNKNLCRMNKRSLLAPPNSIRNMYLQKEHAKGKDLLPNQNEISDCNSITDINVTADDEAIEPIAVIRSDVVTVSKSEISSKKVTPIHNLYDSNYSQSVTKTTGTFLEKVTTTKDNDTKSVSKKICVDKKDIELLKNCIHSMQEEMSMLKDTLICIKETLCKEKSKKDVEEDMNSRESVVEESNIESKIIINVPQIHKIMVDKEVQVEMCCKNNRPESPEPTENEVQTLLFEKSNVFLKELNKDELDFIHEDDKENCNINSLSQYNKISTSESKIGKQASKLIPKHMRVKSSSDDSFVKLEKELCITHMETPNKSCRYSTPLTKVHEKKTAPFLKEYMALKSSISFLETPDVKRFRSFYRSDNNVEPDNSKTYLSSKILTDLHNLYTESPEILES